MKKMIILFIFPLVVCGKMIFSLITANPFDIFPSNIVYPYTHTDLADNGYSSTLITTLNDKELVYIYTLHKGFKHPYAGVVFSKHSRMDISEFDLLKIAISTSCASKLRITIRTNIPGYTDPNVPGTYLYSSYIISTSNKIKEYCIPLKKFTVPFWWYVNNNINTSNPRFTVNFSMVDLIYVESYKDMPLGISDTVTITRFQFVRDLPVLVMVHSALILFYLIIIFVIRFARKRQQEIIRKMNKVVIPYRYLATVDTGNSDARKLFNYLVHNFNDPDLSIDKISTDSSVPVEKIPQIIKKAFGLSYPQYINAIRLMEAKKLLRETDKSITDIALDIGYNNISYFNQIFKKNEGMSPGEFRLHKEK